MPAVKFTVAVSISDAVGDTRDRGFMSADASKYLAYADQTDLFGYHGKIEDVTCRKRNANDFGSVEFTFSAPVARESDITEFLDECETLARVERAECLTNPNI